MSLPDFSFKMADSAPLDSRDVQSLTEPVAIFPIPLLLVVLTGQVKRMLTFWSAMSSKVRVARVLLTYNFVSSAFLFRGHGPLLSLLLLLVVSRAASQTFDTFDPLMVGGVQTMAVQADGAIILAGDFFYYNQTTPRNRIIRIPTNGLTEDAFSPWPNGMIYCMAIQPDGKILVGGDFTNVGGQPRSYLARLRPDGTADTNFNPGADARVTCMAVQADGDIVLGGFFTTVAGQPRAHIARVHADGSLDTDFNPGANETVRALAVQSDGGIIAGGSFSTLGGQPRSGIGRLTSSGNLDASFDPNVLYEVYSIALQADGKILISGGFSQVGIYPRANLARLTSSGAVDLSFDPGANGGVIALALQTDGTIWVGGYFTTLAGTNCGRIARLNPNGTYDTNINLNANNDVTSLGVQSDGKLLMAGRFYSVNGDSHGYAARLLSTGTATQNLSVTGSTVTWMRGGTSPEIWRAGFEKLTASGWTNIGEASRVPGGWSFTAGVPLPTSTTVRARGFVSVGGGTDSGWVVETIAGGPGAGTPPISRTNIAGSTATFAVQPIGTPPFGFRWQKDGSNLLDGGKVSGAFTSQLAVSNVLGADAGNYTVVITNSLGSVTSAVASLTVIDPFITNQPVSLGTNMGNTVTFSAGVIGTTPITYQWLKNGAPLTGATLPTVTLANVQASDTANYTLVASNSFGSTTSSVAAFSVNLALPESLNPGFTDPVIATAIQTNGNILVGGRFSSVAGQTRNGIAQLLPGGALTSFNPGANAHATINCIGIQEDQKIVIGGSFTSIGGQPRTNLARLNADGSLDGSFNAPVSGQVNCVAIETDGNILIGGIFNTVSGQPRTNIARVHSDGGLDAFNPAATTSDTIFYYVAVDSLRVQHDGKILVGGYFDALANQPCHNIARLMTDGKVDTNFTAVSSGEVTCIVEDAGGKILIAGWFSSIGGQPRKIVARLNSDGSLDSSFFFRAEPRPLWWSPRQCERYGLASRWKNHYRRLLPAVRRR
jgi:uncharacterized delta-60 repeat protein